ncbi:AraC family transcriptional regulator [Photobacterium halotolerans]|uniref:Helix-turn-helix domain-containing protein n=1 Tax=Photobacterium halotolerans TaxID=265726 RepID=A0A7X5ATE5_9GAMM|nr:AraC family transcriptional regulator [Photobacterium halotolerans]NAW65777.1 helix-turn-helix domain-containing protein [Photobacterium halotolerans]
MNTTLELAISLCCQLGLASGQGKVNTALKGVSLFKITQYHHVTPQMYQQGVVVIFQGNKIGHLNDYRFEYDTEHCLIVSAPYPIACETFASEEAPLIGIDIGFDHSVIRQLVDDMEADLGADYFASQQQYKGVAASPVTPEIDDCMQRLLSVLHTPIDAKLLGPQILREFFYRLLQSDQRSLLAQYVKQDSALARVSGVIEHVQLHYADKLAVDDLADMAGMSISAFHRAFKQVVTDPPLQYIKKIRLNNAKQLMVQDGVSASVAASKVGYESAAQFSREFKRYFGLPPSKAG